MCRKLIVTNKLSLGNRALGFEAWALPKGELVEFTEKQLKDIIKNGGSDEVYGLKISEETGELVFDSTFYVTNMMNKLHINTLVPMVEDDCLANLFYIVIGTHKVKQEIMDQRKRERLTEYCVYRQDDEHTVGVMINGEPPIYVNINNFNNSDEVYKYKVMCGVIVNEASIENPGNVLTNIKAIGKGIVASETWSLVASFNTEEETVNCKKYIMTKFVRFVANQSVNGRSNVTDNTFECVPLQDFTASSDIDWTQTISDIDKQLYKKYNLSDEEILYIEKMIKPISNEVPKQKVTLNRQEIEAAIVNKLIQSN